MAILETSFLIDILRKFEPAVDLLDELENRETLFITTPTIMDLWEGAFNVKETSLKERKCVENLIASLIVLDFDLKAAKTTAEINIGLKNNPIQPQDSMIAGITLSRGELLVTRDQHFARIPGLKVLKY